MRYFKPVVILAGIATAHASALSQSLAATGIAAVDSANVARAAYRSAGAALQHTDLASARREIARAARAWPTQEAYVWSWASLAARAADTSDVVIALRAYADLGLGRDVRENPNLSRLAEVPAIRTITRQLDANRAPLAASTLHGSVPDSTFYPEGMDVDPRTKHVYVASVRHGTIAELDDRGALVREILPRHRPRIGALLGVRVDTAGNALWATTSGLPQSEGFVAADSSIGALLKIRLSDGSIERRWDLAVAPGGHVLGDLALGPRGDVFFTDSMDPVLYRLRPGADSLERLTSAYFRSLQGMAPSPDGRVLYLADYSHGLLRVELSNGAVTRLTDVPHSTSLGCDGIAWYRNSIIAVQNGVEPGRVMRFVLDSTGTRITRAEVIDRNISVADEPTIGAVLDDAFLYVANSQWNKYTDDGARRLNTKLAPAVILTVPLTR